MRKLKKGLLIVISGPSGTGKGTIIKEIKNLIPDVSYSVSVTTRQPREGEVDGKDYFFRTYEQFKQLMHENAFLETAEVYGNYYGTPKSYVDKLMKEGKDVILEIDIQGALKVKENYPDGVFIFILPPSMSVLRKRLTGRGTETPEAIEMRLGETLKELSFIEKYDYCVVNGELDEAVARVRSIVVAEHSKVTFTAEELVRKYEEE